MVESLSVVSTQRTSGGQRDTLALQVIMGGQSPAEQVLGAESMARHGSLVPDQRSPRGHWFTWTDSFPGRVEGEAITGRSPGDVVVSRAE